MFEFDDKNVELVNTDDKLTFEELRELKKLVRMTAIARVIISVVVGFLGLIGLPAIYEWAAKNVHF